MAVFKAELLTPPPSYPGGALKRTSAQAGLGLCLGMGAGATTAHGEAGSSPGSGSTLDLQTPLKRARGKATASSGGSTNNITPPSSTNSVATASRLLSP